MFVSEPVIVLQLDVVLAKTIGYFNIMSTLSLQNAEELRVSVLKLFVVEDHEDLIAYDQDHQQCQDSALVHKIYYTCKYSKASICVMINDMLIIW